MSPTQIIVLVLVILVVVVLAAVGWAVMRRQSLRRRFGPEYDRLVSEQDSRAAAERELRERERRHADLELRPLSAESRATYAAAWEELQARFVDAPVDAVAAGDELVTRLVAERGYPTTDYEEQLAHLSVDHARTLGHYRDAHEIFLRNQRGEASTEQLRQALVHYRALFADLLGEDPVRRPDQPRPDTPQNAPRP
jgi:ribosomal protein L13E